MTANVCLIKSVRVLFVCRYLSDIFQFCTFFFFFLEKKSKRMTTKRRVKIEKKVSVTVSTVTIRQQYKSTQQDLIWLSIGLNLSRITHTHTHTHIHTHSVGCKAVLSFTLQWNFWKYFFFFFLGGGGLAEAPSLNKSSAKWPLDYVFKYMLVVSWFQVKEHNRKKRKEARKNPNKGDLWF